LKKSKRDAKVKIITYCGIITSLKVQIEIMVMKDIVLGYDSSLSLLLSDEPLFLGHNWQI